MSRLPSDVIGETQATLFKQTLQLSHEQKDSAIYKHLMNCDGYKHITSLFKIDCEEFDEVSFKMNLWVHSLVVVTLRYHRYDRGSSPRGGI